MNRERFIDWMIDDTVVFSGDVAGHWVMLVATLPGFGHHAMLREGDIGKLFEVSREAYLLFTQGKKAMPGFVHLDREFFGRVWDAGQKLYPDDGFIGSAAQLRDVIQTLLPEAPK